MKRLLFEDYVKMISKQEIENVYIQQNKTVKECLKMFNISQTTFMRLLSYYQIHKPKNLHTANIKKSKLERFGDPNYNNHEKRTQTNLEKYGVENQFQRAELFPQIQQLKQDRYGSYNNVQKNMETRIKNSGSLEASYTKQHDTYKQTCLKKYGIANTAKLTEVRQQIANTLKDTFIERYGAENYWAMPNARRSNGSKNSKANMLFKALLDEKQIQAEAEFPLNGKWFDFKIGDALIEINPSATHNSTWGIYNDSGLSKEYHKQKTSIAAVNGYHCVHVFDWDDQNKIIKMFEPKKHVYARDCITKELSAVEAANFLTKNHLQGYAKDKIRLGLVYNEELVAIMTFDKPRYNKKYEYEIIRYCAEANIVGGAEKLFKHFLEVSKATSVISYCDLSKFTGKVYEKLGFSLARKSAPAKHWYNMKTKQHITDNLLRQRGFDQLFKTNFGKGTSNEELMLNHNFVEIYDCGQATYVWHNK